MGDIKVGQIYHYTYTSPLNDQDANVDGYFIVTRIANAGYDNSKDIWTYDSYHLQWLDKNSAKVMSEVVNERFFDLNRMNTRSGYCKLIR